MSTTLTYPVQLTSAAEGGFIVTSPVISIFTQGDTEAEALKNAEEAILCHIEGCEKERKNMPPVQLMMIEGQAPDTLKL